MGMERSGPPHVRTGRAGEDAALARYRSLGYTLVARNWRCPLGELDLVLARRALVVFCEVKTRRGHGFGGPFESVTWRKQRKLRALAVAFLEVAGPPEATEFRFDVASVTADGRGDASVFVYEGAF